MSETKGVAPEVVEATEGLTHDAADGDRDAMTTPTSKRTTPAFQFYPKDFLTSQHVIDMSMTERGMYITLLSYCWLEGSLPHDPQKLARMCRMPLKQFVKIWTHGVLHECFSEKNGRLTNSRMERERKKQDDYRKGQREKAQRSWSQRLATAEPMANSMPSHPSGNALLSSSSSSSSSSTPEKRESPRAPLHDNSHRKHAHCGRVCLPASLFSEFVRRRNHDAADQEIRDWAMVVENEWASRLDEPGDSFDFWKARYAEKWPTAKAAAADKWEASLPEWARKVRAQKQGGAA